MKQQAKATVRLLPGILLAVLVSLSVVFCAFAAEDDTQSAVSYIARTWDLGTNVGGNATVIATFEKHAHHYSSPVWTWADDYSSAKAAFTCACGDVQTVDAEITEEELTPADCTTEQVAVFTATVTFGGDTYTDETDAVSVPGSACHVYGIRITPATCTHDGITTYKCVRCGNTYTENPVAATGHRDDDHNGVCDNCGETMPGSPDTPSQSGKCKWCGKTHRGFWQSIVGFWHTIFYLWAHLFGKR